MYQALFWVPGDTEINNIGSLPLKGSEYKPKKEI